MTSVKFFPPKQRLVANLKLVKVVSNLSQEEFDGMTVNSGKRGILEVCNHKKFGTVRTVYRIANDQHEGESVEAFTELDRAIMSVCDSNWDAGNHHISSAIILRGLSGKNNRENGYGKIYPEQRDAILASLKKLMTTLLEIDLSDTNEKLKYHEGQRQILSAAILPCEIKSTVINGQVVEDAIHLLDDSIFMKLARERKQILTFDTALLDASDIKNTPMNIILKNYVMCRVTEIKLHRNLKPILTFEDIFRKARITDASRDTKMNARNVVEKFFEHLKANNLIKSFELTKKGNAFYSVKFVY